MEQALLRVDATCDVTAPAIVRDALTRTKGIEPVLDDILLIASELVTNAVIHSGCLVGEIVEVGVFERPGRIVLWVRDPGHSGTEAAVGEGDRGGHGGFGLRVVEEVALTWGAERDGGYRVWAELPLGRTPCLTEA